MYRDIYIESIIKTQLNIEKQKGKSKQSFAECLQHSIAIERSKKMSDIDIRECPVCGKKVSRADMYYTRDCHGITFRLVCFECYPKLMEKGYDGERYTELDECLD